MRQQGRSKTRQSLRCPTSNCRQRVLLVLLQTGKNTWKPLSPSQEQARGGACSGVLTFSQLSGPRETCRFLLNTQLMFLKNEKDPTTKAVRRRRVDPLVDDVDPKKVRAHSDGRVPAEIRLAATFGLSEGEIAALTSPMRQIGVGTPGGAEALAIFHQLLYDEWMTGSLSGPLARIKVGEKNCLGMIEWKAVRETAWRFLPKYTAAATWTHRNLSHVEQEGLSPMPKDRGAEQGDVDGPLECSLAAGLVAGRDAWKHSRAASGGHPSLGWRERPCRGTASASRPRGPNGRNRQTSSLAAQKNTPVPMIRNTRCRRMEVLRINGTWTTSPCVCPFLQDFDVANARVGAERNSLKTEVLYYVNDLDAAAPEHHTLSCCRVSAVHHEPAPEQGRCHPCTSAASSPRIRRQSSPPSGKVSASAVSTTSGGFTATQSWRNKGRHWSTTRLGSGLSGLTEDSVTQATLSQSGIGFQKSARHRCSCTPGSSHRSQAARPGYAPRRSLGRPSPSALDSDEQATAH